jgi:hypothetical protein
MKLFKKLAAIHSASHKEQPIIHYIMRWVKSSVKGAVIEYDHDNNNLYITKGEAETYPCMVAHLDQVQQRYPKDVKIVETEDIIFSYSPRFKRQCGLGADDKCGIWMALKMLQKHDAMKVAFFSGEEVGCCGSYEARMEFFGNVRFVIEPDRRGDYDLITSISRMSLCSDEFLQDIHYAAFGFEKTYGLMTDVMALKEQGLSVSCINVSCGYYEPHTENEFVVKAAMENTLDFIDNIITNCTKVYTHVAEVKPYGSTLGGFGFGDWFGKSYKSDSKSGDTKSNKVRHDDLYFDDYYDGYGDYYDLMDDDEAQYIIDEIAEILNDTPLATDEEIFNTLHEFMPGISQEKMSEYISWTKAFYNY